MLRVGLTGGIGTGKSEVARRLAAYGAVVIDADVIAREVVEPGTPGLAAIREVFGPGVLRPDGALDREKLAGVVFADPERLATLNGIVHPLVRNRMAELEKQAAGAPVVVHDLPLLAEGGLAAVYDEVIVVDVAPRVQLERLMRERGMSREQAEARMAAQATRGQRLAVATLVVDNSGSLSELDREVGELWAELSRRARARQS